MELFLPAANKSYFIPCSEFIFDDPSNKVVNQISREILNKIVVVQSIDSREILSPKWRNPNESKPKTILGFIMKKQRLPKKKFKIRNQGINSKFRNQ